MKTRFAHQSEIFEATKESPFYALFWEMRCGKTIPIIDTFVYWYEQGRITAAVIIAPSGVHINWSRIALKEERPNDNIFEWSDKIKQVGQQAKLKAMVEDTSKMLWICINCEALITDTCKEFMHGLVKKRSAALAVDESDDFKNPKARRTKALLGRAAKYTPRRILTGTPAPSGPFDFWSQFAILSKTILGNLYTTFKQRYGIFKRVRYGGPMFDELVEYKDLDHLTARIAPYVSRLTRKEVYKNLPEVIPMVEHFVMSKEVAKAYEEMKTTLMLELDSGLIVTAQQRIVALLRLQQISRGYIGDVDGVVHKLPGENNAIDCLMRVLKNVEGKVLIWCRFKQDVTEVLNAIKASFPNEVAVRYDGEVEKEQRFENKERFINFENYRWLVGTEATGGIGIDLAAAETSIHFSHAYNLRLRLQSDARFEGPNQKALKLLKVDIVGADTKDLEILSKLDAKEDMMVTLTGDKLREILK